MHFYLALLVSLLAFPFCIGCEETKRYKVVLASDVSGSMAGDKLDDSIQAQLNFITTIPLSTCRLGLVTFGKRARLAQPLTSNPQNIKKALQSYKALGKTPLFKALQISYGELKDRSIMGALFGEVGALFGSDGEKDKVQDTEKILVLSTDGHANGGYSEQQIINLGSKIKGEGIKIVTIAIGQGADEKLLKKLASSSEDYYEAGCSRELAGLYEVISAGITPTR